MKKEAKYTIFNTKWGYFGLAGTDSGLCRTQLPGANREKIKSLLLKNLPSCQFDKNFLKPLQEQIAAYFEGTCVKFDSNIPLFLNGFSPFGTSVLAACRNIGFGQTTTYGQLAKKSCSPNASRAAGSVLAKNPLPLIIPCHRIIRNDGKLGGFTSPGGITLKKRLLSHENPHGNI
jgi:methylated-DNA-[protein]-cysteine S-methyltransferase